MLGLRLAHEALGTTGSPSASAFPAEPGRCRVDPDRPGADADPGGRGQKRRIASASGRSPSCRALAGVLRWLSLPLGPYLDDGHGGWFCAEIAPGVPRAVLHDRVSRPQAGQLPVVEFQPQVTV